MDQKPVKVWEAGSETEMENALEVLYEMTTGYVLGELQQEHPEEYAKLTTHARSKSQFLNNVRYTIDVMLSELLEEYTGEDQETES